MTTCVISIINDSDEWCDDDDDNDSDDDVMMIMIMMMMFRLSQIFHPLVTTCVIPIISLIGLNYSIFMGSIRIVSNHDVHLSRIMVTIVTIFILVTIPRVKRKRNYV